MMEEAKILTDSERFIECNQKSFQELLTFIDFAEEDKFTLGFIEVNFPSEVDILVDRLQQYFQNEEIQLEVFQFPDPSLRFLRDALKEEIPKRNISSNKKTVFILRDLEYSIGVYGSYPPVLADLNFVRDAYKLYVRHPVLFVLPDFAINRVIRFAPDFWDWRSGFFRFKTTQETRKFIEDTTLKFDGYVESLNISEKQEIIDKYHRLLMEYYPTGQQIKEENIQKYSETLFKLGKVHESQGDYHKARQYLEDTLEFANQEKILKIKVKAMDYLAWCDYKQAKFQQAIISSQQSLTITRELGNPNEEASSLCTLGSIYSIQGKYNNALKYHQQSLEIARKIGNRYGIAASFNNLAAIFISQGKFSDSTKYVQQSLDIFKELGNRYGIAQSLCNLGNAYYFLKEYYSSIKYYQESLNLNQELGNLSGIACAFGNLGNIFSDLKEYNKALEYYQKCLEIAKEINDNYYIGVSLHNLGNVYTNLSEYSQAKKHYQEALDIAKDIESFSLVSDILGNLGRAC